MRKVLKFAILFMIIVFGLQVCVNADMGAPMIKPYKAKVINPEGVVCYDHQGNVITKLEYGDEIEITFEYSWSEEKNASFEVKKEGQTTETAYINFKDFAPVEEIYVSKKLKTDEPIDRVVVAEDGAELYKGPGLGYDKLGVVIPRGSEIVTYSDSEGYGDNPWFYTTYEGTSGWVCELETLGEYTDNVEILFEETTVTKLSKGEETPEVLDTIPANTIVKNPILLDPWEQSYYIKYNGKWGRIGSRLGLWTPEKIKIFTTDKEYKIYEETIYTYGIENESDVELPKVLGTIPANTKIAIKYEHEYSGSSYISYNGIRGWVAVPYTEDAEYVKTTDLELPNFDDFNVIEGEKIPVGEAVVNEDTSEDREDIIVGDVVVPDGIEKGEETNNSNVITIQVTPEQIVAFGVVAAVVITLTCVVTIVLINKTSKKETKKEEVKTENKE